MKQNTISKKNNKVLLLSLALVLSCSLASCGNTSKLDETLDKNFAIDTSAKEVNFGTDYMIEPASAKDVDGNWHDATIKVTDPDGNTLDVEAGKFTPTKIGTYTITYTITANGYEYKREITLNVKDLSEPEIEGMADDNLIMLGEEVDLSKIVVKDNVDGAIVPQISVKYGNEEVQLNDKKFTADKEGCYVVTVKATDVAGNKLEKDLNVFTSINYEQEIVQQSEFYPISISDKFNSYRPGNVGKINWFDTNVSWLNDFCLLGSETEFLSNAKYLSFWMYADGTVNDLSQLLLISKYTYFDTIIYSEYGQRLDYYWQGVLGDNAPEELKEMYKDSEYKFTYQLETNNWYRVVIDLTKLTNAARYGVVGSPIEGALEAKANPKGFKDVPFGFGTWDRKISAEATKVVDTYIDDIRLTNTLDDETYRQEIKVNVTSDKSVTAKPNDTFTINYNVTPENSGNVTFKSTNEEVATVDENGVVTCISEGQAAIVLTSVNDNRKTETVAVTVVKAGAMVRDELHQVVFSGGKTIGDWETDGKYNMVEHMAWACNDDDNGVCKHNLLVNMSIAHGDANSYTPLTKDADGNFVGGGDSPVRINGGWQAFMGGTDGLLFVFNAKENISIKTTGDTVENKIGGWVSDTKWQWLKVKEDGTIESLHEFVNPEFGNVESDWFEINKGETFILLVRSNGDADTRNFELLPFFYICPMIEPAE